ncbi:MAG: hypothetical protein ABJ349_11160 [Hyphomicrobiales bacterium]
MVVGVVAGIIIKLAFVAALHDAASGKREGHAMVYWKRNLIKLVNRDVE